MELIWTYVVFVTRFQEAVDYILRQPNVIKPKAGVIGVSKGAEMAMLLSSLCPKVWNNAAITDLRNHIGME